MTCSYCGAEEKLPREGQTAWYTCGTYGPVMAPGRTWRSDECCLREDVMELKKELAQLNEFIAELKAEIERLKANQKESDSTI